MESFVTYAACLKFVKCWKFQNTYYHQARMECQNEVLVYMEDIMVMRKKILSGNVPIEELREMRSELVRKIDLGNQ